MRQRAARGRSARRARSSAGAQQRPARRGRTAPAPRRRSRRRARLSRAARRQAAEVDRPAAAPSGGGSIDLARLAVLGSRSVVRSDSCRAHDLVERAAAAPPRRARPRSRSAQRDVVGAAAGLELVEEPEPLLGERQRSRLGERAGDRRAPGSRRSAGVSSSSRSSATRSSSAGVPRSAEATSSAPLGEGPPRRRRWPRPRRFDSAQRQLDAEGLADLGDRRGWRAASGRRGRRSCRGRPTRGTPGSRPRSRRPSPRSACVAATNSIVGLEAGAVRRGRALRSTLPLAFSGRASMKTIADGTMYSGSFVLEERLQLRGAHRGPCRGTTYATSRSSPACPRAR